MHKYFYSHFPSEIPLRGKNGIFWEIVGDPALRGANFALGGGTSFALRGRGPNIQQHTSAFTEAENGTKVFGTCGPRTPFSGPGRGNFDSIRRVRRPHLSRYDMQNCASCPPRPPKFWAPNFDDCVYGFSRIEFADPLNTFGKLLGAPRCCFGYVTNFQEK